MHPLVRDLYKRVLHVGRDYPLGLDYVKRVWKQALTNPANCPACYTRHVVRPPDGDEVLVVDLSSEECERELRKAVAKGRHMVREMIGVIQLKKYRTMKKRYDHHNNNINDPVISVAMKHLEDEASAEKPWTVST